MTDAITKLRLKKIEQQRAIERERVINEGVATYARAGEMLAELRQTIDFGISDDDLRKTALDELQQFVEVINECVPAVIRTTYDERQASRKIEPITGGVM